MRFVAPCGHEGTPVTANFVTCPVCDRAPNKVEAHVKPPTLTLKTLRQYRDEMIKACFGVEIAKDIDLNGVGAAFAEHLAEQLFELQQFARSLSPEAFL